MNESRHVVSRQTSVCRPPTKLVDRSYSAYKKAVACSSQIPPTKLVDRSYSAYKKAVACSSQIPPTKLVDCSYSAYKKAVARMLVPNPTNEVGGSFILCLQRSSELRSFCSPINAVWWDCEWRAPDLL